MKVAALFLASFLLQQANGCEEKAPQTVAAPTPMPPTHRFENVSGNGSPGIALDTLTGQWCRTWDWSYKAKPDADSLNTLPTCLSLFQQVWGPAATLKYNPKTGQLGRLDDPLGIRDDKPPKMVLNPTTGKYEDENKNPFARYGGKVISPAPPK